MAKTLDGFLAVLIIAGQILIMSQYVLPCSISQGFAGENKRRKPIMNKNIKLEKKVRSLLDLMFRQRKVREAFEEYFSFSKLSQKEKRAVETASLQYSEEYMSLDAKLVARIFTSSWNYEYQAAFLALGTKSLDEFSEAFEEAQSEIDSARKRIIGQRGLSEGDFYRLLGGDAVKDSKNLENDLSMIESINTDLLRFMEKKIDKALYEKNVKKMNKSILIKKQILGDTIFYGVSIKPMFKLVFVKRNGVVKLIAFGDSI